MNPPMQKPKSEAGTCKLWQTYLCVVSHDGKAVWKCCGKNLSWSLAHKGN